MLHTLVSAPIPAGYAYPLILIALAAGLLIGRWGYVTTRAFRAALAAIDLGQQTGRVQDDEPDEPTTDVSVEPADPWEDQPEVPAHVDAYIDADDRAIPDDEDGYPRGRHEDPVADIHDHTDRILHEREYLAYLAAEMNDWLAKPIFTEPAYPIAVGRAAVPRADGKPHDPTAPDPIPKPGPAPKTVLRKRKPSKAGAR